MSQARMPIIGFVLSQPPRSNVVWKPSCQKPSRAPFPPDRRAIPETIPLARENALAATSDRLAVLGVEVYEISVLRVDGSLCWRESVFCRRIACDRKEKCLGERA